MDHYYLLQFLNESLFAEIQPLQTLNRLQLSFTVLKTTFPVQGLLSATVTPWPLSYSAQGACAERAENVTLLYLLLFVLFSLVLFLNNLLLPQPALLQYSVGHFVTFYCQPSSLHQNPKPFPACRENYRHNRTSTTTACNVKDRLLTHQDSFLMGT